MDFHLHDSKIFQLHDFTIFQTTYAQRHNVEIIQVELTDECRPAKAGELFRKGEEKPAGRGHQEERLEMDKKLNFQFGE